MPTKHIDHETWEAVETTLVKAVSISQKPVKESDLLRLLIRVGIDRVKDDELKNLSDNKPRCGAIFLTKSGVKHLFEPNLAECLTILNDIKDKSLLVIYGKTNSGKSTLIGEILKKIGDDDVLVFDENHNINDEKQFTEMEKKLTILSMYSRDKDDAMNKILLLTMNSNLNFVFGGTINKDEEKSIDSIKSKLSILNEAKRIITIEDK
ncbi:TPA: hypothetical protein SMT83_003476 [Proteus mirabilis]|nr:hypothetical protein [Proteus mirabilis]